MRIGIDFDNTIVNYDGVFHQSAVNLGWMPASVGHDKNSVKGYFIDRDEEPRWTELQGIVYGRDIRFAKPYAGVGAQLKRWHEQGHALYLVSHKTRYPIIGEALDFHAAARNWLAEHELGKWFEAMYFCPQKDQKIAQIADLNLDVFIDDLPSILLHPEFPVVTTGVLFAPQPEQHDLTDIHYLATHWDELEELLAL